MGVCPSAANSGPTTGCESTAVTSEYGMTGEGASPPTFSKALAKYVDTGCAPNDFQARSAACSACGENSMRSVVRLR